MATDLRIGEHVYVPTFKIENYRGDGFLTHVHVEIKEFEKNSAIFFYNNVRHKVSKSFCYRDVGVLLITIGDFSTEDTTLDPLRKSVFNYLKLIVDTELIRELKVRSLKEIDIFWKKHHPNYSHVIVIGHGEGDGILFVTESEKCDCAVDAEKFMSQFSVDGMRSKIFINLVCHSGRSVFAREASKFEFCEGFICPFDAVHSAISSQFLQTFFALHFLQGRTVQVAFKKAIKMIVGAVKFRYWKNGSIYISSSSSKK